MPRRASKRRKTLKTEAKSDTHITREPSGDESILVEESQTQPAATERSSDDAPSLFSRLPLELLLSLPEYFPVVPWPIQRIDRPIGLPKVPTDYFTNHDLLCSLSQTCQQLRAIFLPLLWRRLDAPYIGISKKQHSCNVGVQNVLLRRSTGILKNPQLGVYVRLAVNCFICSVKLSLCSQHLHCFSPRTPPGRLEAPLSLCSLSACVTQSRNSSCNSRVWLRNVAFNASAEDGDRRPQVSIHTASHCTPFCSPDCGLMPGTINPYICGGIKASFSDDGVVAVAR